MTRTEQIDKALALLAPPLREREDCRKHVAQVLDVMKGVDRAARHAKVTKKTMRAYSAALRRLQAASKAHVAAGGSLALSLERVDRAVAFDVEWSARWRPPSRWLKHEQAVARAHELLTGWNQHDIVVSSRDVAQVERNICSATGASTCIAICAPSPPPPPRLSRYARDKNRHPARI